MAKIKYQNIALKAGALEIIATCNQIIEEYQGQGFELTLRQLYYQMVSRDIIPNKQSEYKRLGSIVNDGRLAGLIDWDAIVDRTRELRSIGHWTSPSEIMEAIAEQFRMDKWKTQKYRPEVWIEKDALIGVIEGVCTELDVPYFSCRGYTSQSEMWGAAMRFVKYLKAGQTPYVIHLGDHDPSGKDMSRDIEDRLEMFIKRHVANSYFGFKRIALNMDQVEQYEPPPNPAKLTDSRCHGYIAEFGDSSWELDALEPTVLAGLIRSAIDELRISKKWALETAKENEHRSLLGAAADRWHEVVAMLGEA